MAIVTIGWVMFRVTDGEALFDALVAIPTDFRFAALAIAVGMALAPYALLMIAIDVLDRRFAQAERRAGGSLGHGANAGRPRLVDHALRIGFRCGVHLLPVLERSGAGRWPSLVWRPYWL